ncbi:MAG: hypothetical protein K2P98_04775 [Neisseriaceae bacterium]|nr:hypothetical protein [Neisseriaceae bacterium]
MRKMGIGGALMLACTCLLLQIEPSYALVLPTNSASSASKIEALATTSAPVSAGVNSSAASSGVVKRDIMKEVEQERVRLLIDKGAADDLAKVKTKKNLSAECQFWRQQKLTGKSAKADDKVKQFCGV